MTTPVTNRLAAKAPYAWRGTAPAFDDSRPLVVFDGVCVLCARSMRFIARHDAAGTIQFTAAQSRLGQALFNLYGLDAAAFETVLFVESGRAYGKRDAVASIARHLDLPWRLGRLYGWLPRRFADAAYDAVAGRRYRLFGRTDACLPPDPSWRARVID